jgi:hypothetical protein
MASKRLALLLVISAGACGGSDAGGEADAAPVPTGWVSLVSADWTMSAGTEGYVCARATVPYDMYISEYRPIAPPGTHHTALSIAPRAGVDETFPCEASDIGFRIIFGSGVGTTPFALPPGVAYKLAANEQVLLNLHLYDTGETDISGTSGIEVKLIPASEVLYEAETAYIGSYDLTVPPGASTTDVSCTMTEETTIFGVFPHMHKLGTHLKGSGVLAAGGDAIVLLDSPYSFEEQLNYPVLPAVTLQPGDSIRAECSYDNPGTTTIHFGDSTDDEMCVLGVYRYPARGGISLCFQ